MPSCRFHSSCNAHRYRYAESTGQNSRTEASLGRLPVSKMQTQHCMPYFDTSVDQKRRAEDHHRIDMNPDSVCNSVPRMDSIPLAYTPNTSKHKSSYVGKAPGLPPYNSAHSQTFHNCRSTDRWDIVSFQGRKTSYQSDHAAPSAARHTQRHLVGMNCPDRAHNLALSMIFLSDSHRNSSRIFAHWDTVYTVPSPASLSQHMAVLYNNSSTYRIG